MQSARRAPVPSLVYSRRQHVISLNAIPDASRGQRTV
jgi:hypothetical protein